MKLFLFFFIFFHFLSNSTSVWGSESEYDQLLQMMHTNSNQKVSCISTQSRQGVEKNLLMEDQGKRRHFKLSCAKSEIQLLYDENKKMEIIEQMEDVTCIMPEKADHQNQMVQVLYADSGTYFYQHNLFEASSVRLFRYITSDLSNNDLISSYSELQPNMSAFISGKLSLKWSGSL